MKVTDRTALRLFPIDLLKALSIVAVVSFHSLFVLPTTYTSSASYLLDSLFAPLKFCVPVLFTLSFFLLKLGLEKNSKQTLYPFLKKRLIRLAIPTAFWFGLAIIIKKIIWYQDKKELFLFSIQGQIFPGAYYLLVLFQFVPLFIWLHPWFDRPRNILITFVFQCLVFLLIYASSTGVFGIELPRILLNIHRPFFIYWFVYMALGAYLYNNWGKIVSISGKIPLYIKILLLGITSLIIVAEFSYLRSFTGNKIAPYEYVLFSCILSVVVFFICFAAVEESQLPVKWQKIIKLLSKYSLGIFCINGFLNITAVGVVAKFARYANFSFPEILVMKLLGWIVLVAISLLLAIALDKLGLGNCVR